MKTKFLSLAIIALSLTTFVSVSHAEEEKVQITARDRFTAGLGITSFSYSQQGLPSYNSVATTVRASYHYLIAPPMWDLGLSAYLTAFQFSKTTDTSARYFGGNARVGYIFPEWENNWQFSLYAGLYYTTMFVSDNQFGFTNLGGPQLYPMIKKTFEDRNSAALYVKYSPIASKLSLLSLANREIAVGMVFTHPLENDHTISATIDYSNIHASIDSTQSDTHSFTVGASYGF